MTNDEWIAEVKRLETFFKETPILIKEYKNGYMTVSDIPKFIDSHLASARANVGNPWFAQGISRLQELEQAIRNQI